MLRTRVMPCLLLRGKGLIKTKKFQNAQYIGDPINAVRIFNQKEVDELVLFDIDATAKNLPIQYELIEQITSECFMPLCYGGGVRSLADFRELFYLGVEKVSVSSLLFSDPEIVKQAVAIYGSQSIVATLDIKKTWKFGKYSTYTHSGTRNCKYSPLEAANFVSQLGVGEIILNTVDREGTWLGFDVDLVRSVAEHVTVPVVAVGGAGSLDHIKEVIYEAKASAVGLGSMAVFQAQDKGVLIKFPKMSELEILLNFADK